MTANAMGGKKENGDPFSAADFFPSLRSETPVANNEVKQMTEEEAAKTQQQNMAALQMFTWIAKAQGLKPE